jgi:hypothetical protein
MDRRGVRLTAVLTIAGLVGALAAAAAPAGAATEKASAGISDYTLSSVSAVSGADAWAVGSYSQRGRTFIYGVHWNGHSWARTSLPSIRGTLSSVSARSAGDVWAVGQASWHRSSLILHWNGKRWSQVASPSPGQVFTSLSGVAAVSATDAWAVGVADDDSGAQALILRWNGTSWSESALGGLGSVSSLAAVSAASSSSAWAVGAANRSDSASVAPVTVRWNGSGWHQVASPDPGRTDGALLDSVSERSASDVWAVGYDYPVRQQVPGIASIDPLALRWKAGAWRIVPVPSPRGSVESRLTGVSAFSPGDAWAVGYFAVPGRNCCVVTRAEILHWNGTRWSLVFVPDPGPAGHKVNSLNGVIAASKRGTWAVGSYYQVPPDSSHTPVQDRWVVRWNGRTWSTS